jgi:hypothetical protein
MSGTEQSSKFKNKKNIKQSKRRMTFTKMKEKDLKLLRFLINNKKISQVNKINLIKRRKINEKIKIKRKMEMESK